MPPLTEMDSLPVGSDGVEVARFCSRCGSEHTEAESGRRLGGRVCEACGMGVLLRCSSAAMPAPGAPFLIVTADLRVSAVSEGAEPLLGTEDATLGLDVRELLTSPLGEEALAESVTMAATHVTDPAEMPALAARSDDVGMMIARIATCGPPRAALVAVEPSTFGQR